MLPPKKKAPSKRKISNPEWSEWQTDEYVRVYSHRQNADGTWKFMFRHEDAVPRMMPDLNNTFDEDNNYMQDDWNEQEELYQDYGEVEKNYTFAAKDDREPHSEFEEVQDEERSYDEGREPAQGYAELANLKEAAYASVSNPRGFFKAGKVFMTQSKAGSNLGFSSKDGNWPAFVVMQKGDEFSICCPLQFVLREKPPKYLVPVYRSALKGGSYENKSLRSEQKSLEKGFPIVVESTSVKIDPYWRINFAEKQTLGYDIKVHAIGRIDRDFLKQLKAKFLEVQENIKPVIPQTDNDGFKKFEAQEEPCFDPFYSSRDSPSAIVPRSDWEQTSNARSQTSLGGKLPYPYVESKLPAWLRPWEGNAYCEFPNTLLSKEQNNEPASIQDTRADAEGAYEIGTRHISSQSLPENSDCEDSDVSSNRYITTASNTIDTDLLNKAFKIQPSKEYEFGRVFKVLWTEPQGDIGARHPRYSNGGEYVTKYGEKGYTSIRRFVVISSQSGHSLCVPILTYEARATTKRGVKSQDHAIVYMEQQSRNWTRPKEIDGEEKLRKRPIRIEPKTPRDRLDPKSRINYAKIYTVEHNVKVQFIGKIHHKSLPYFKRDYNLTHPSLSEDDLHQGSESDEDVDEDDEEYDLDAYQDEAIDPANKHYKY